MQEQHIHDVHMKLLTAFQSWATLVSQSCIARSRKTATLETAGNDRRQAARMGAAHTVMAAMRYTQQAKR